MLATLVSQPPYPGHTGLQLLKKNNMHKYCTMVMLVSGAFWYYSMNNQADQCKKLPDYIPLLLYSEIHSTISANLYQGQDDRTGILYFVPLSLLPTHNLKIFNVWEYYAYQTTSQLQWMCLQKRFVFSFGRFWHICSIILGVSCILRAHPNSPLCVYRTSRNFPK